MPIRQDTGLLDAKGAPWREIARRLGVSRETVKKYAQMEDCSSKPASRPARLDRAPDGDDHGTRARPAAGPAGPRRQLGGGDHGTDGVHGDMDARGDRVPRAFETRAPAAAGRVPPIRGTRRVRLDTGPLPGRLRARGARVARNPPGGTRTWSCSGLPARARRTWPSPSAAKHAEKVRRHASPPSAGLAGRLPRAKTDNRLDKELAIIGKAGLPVIDEEGYVPVDEEGSRLLFQVAANAYERQNVVYATNVESGGWGRVFDDPNMAAAIIDRTVHHGRMIRFDGDSYRRTHALMEQPHTTKNKRAAGTPCSNGPIPAAHLDQNNTLKRTTST